MKNKTVITMLLASLITLAGFAKEPTPAPVPLTAAQVFSNRITAAPNLDALYPLEKEFAANLSQYSDVEIEGIAWWLTVVYHARASAEHPEWGWSPDVRPVYAPNFATSTSAVVRQYFYDWARLKYFPTSDAITVARTPAQLDAAMAVFSENTMPERFKVLGFDSREALVDVGSGLWIGYIAADKARRAAHPDAVNYAVMYYRYISMSLGQEAIDGAVRTVALALKSKDLNIKRANEWIASQNVGGDSVLTDQEKALPSLIQQTYPALQPSNDLEAAKQAYRTASTSAEVDAAVYKVADALKAIDLNLVRANAWIKAQKEGTNYDLP